VFSTERMTWGLHLTHIEAYAQASRDERGCGANKNPRRAISIHESRERRGTDLGVLTWRRHFVCTIGWRSLGKWILVEGAGGCGVRKRTKGLGRQEALVGGGLGKGRCQVERPKGPPAEIEYPVLFPPQNPPVKHLGKDTGKRGGFG
jgi:hypothetical protein